MELHTAQRERAAFDLAERLFFKLEKHGDRYSLRRKVGEFAPRTDLSLDEVEQLQGGNCRALAASWGYFTMELPAVDWPKSPPASRERHTFASASQHSHTVATFRSRMCARVQLRRREI